MGFVDCEAFAGYTAASDYVNSGWVVTGGTHGATSGRFGGGGWTSSASTTGIKKSFPAISGRTILQHALKPGAISAQSRFVRFYNNSGADLCLEVGYSAAGALQVWNAAGTLIHTGTAGELASSMWHSIGIDADIGNSAGAVKIWLDQPGSGATPLVDLSGVDMTDGSSAGCDMIEFTNAAGATQAFVISDVIILDSDGGAPDAYLGDKRLYAQIAVAETATQDWTPQSGTDNGLMVDDPLSANADGDTTYNQATAATKRDLYTFADISTTASGIVGVVVELEAKKTDAGSPPSDFKARVDDGSLSNGTSGPALTLLTSYKRFRSFFADVPGGTGWTAAQVNAAVAGPELV